MPPRRRLRRPPLRDKNRRPQPNSIRDWRKFRKLTLEQLEEKSGVSTATISNLERRVHGYSWETLEALADALGVLPGDLLSRPPLQDETINDLWTSLSIADRSRAIEMLRILTRRPPGND